MVVTLVDSNVILDVVGEDPEWFDWSAAMLARAAEQGRLVINPLIYAEVSLAYDTIEALDAAVPAEYYTREPLPWDAAFLAARAFLRYRHKGGARVHPLPDFTSAPTPRSPATRCSPAIRAATAHTSRN